MKSLKSIVRTRLIWLTVCVMAIILLVALFFQIIATQMQAKANADATFTQIQQVMNTSAAELAAVESEYRETCLLNARVISYVIKHNPGILGNVEEFRQLARKLEVDEIHIFDNTGCIFTGSHPEYFGYNFDSGEQIGFFRPLLTNKSLWLCQDITPNTAEGKLVQYSALWSEDGQYIVQIGMYPDAVLEVTEKTELSYIFSLLQGTPGVSLYAINSETGVIVGSSNGVDNGKMAGDIGVMITDMHRYKKGAHATVNGVDSYCIFKDIDGTLIGYVISNDSLYNDIPTYTLMLILCLLIVSAVLVFVVQNYTDRYIIGSIASTNERLRAVTEGNLDERVDVQSSREFSELSSHINSMIKRLLAQTDKMDLVLDRTNLRIGVYEYNTNMKHVRFTEHVPRILGLEGEELSRLTDDYREMRKFIKELCTDPVPGAENTYRFTGSSEMYVKLEEISDGSAVLGILMDVTEETVSRMRAEIERDIDSMTGLYNRRGMERRFEVLFAKPSEMRHGAMIVIDSDNLKDINDTYGHASGDIFLKSLADMLRDFNAPKQLTARVGGDEFVLLIYGYKSENDVQAALEKMRLLQDSATVTIDGTVLPLTFSCGYELTYARSDHERMFKSADANMYDSKRIRKRSLK